MMFRKLPIRKKIAMSYIIVFGILLFAISLFSLGDIEREQMQLVEFQLSDYSTKLQSELVRQVYDGSFPDKHKFEDIAAEGLIDRQFRIVDAEFKTVVLFKNILGEYGADWIKNLLNNKWFEIHKDDFHFYCMAVSIDAPDGKKYYLITAASLSEYKRQVHLHVIFFPVAVPVFLLLAAFAAHFISRLSFEPVKKIIATAKSITVQDLHRRIEVSEAKDEIRELGETLNDMIERLEKSFESQKKFIADASHEIKTPLTIIHSNLELISDKIDSGDLKKEIKKLLDEVDRLSKLVNSLLALAKFDSGSAVLQLEIIRLDEVIMETIQSLSKIGAEKQIQWNLQVEDAIEFLGDSRLLKSVFTNVLDNAIKYSRENGIIKVELLKAQCNVIIRISDEGIGISEDEIPHLFKRFHRSNEIRGKIAGSGLGLSIAENIIKLHRGSISIESKKDSGTGVSIILPVVSLQ